MTGSPYISFPRARVKTLYGIPVMSRHAPGQNPAASAPRIKNGESETTSFFRHRGQKYEIIGTDEVATRAGGFAKLYELQSTCPTCGCGFICLARPAQVRSKRGELPRRCPSCRKMRLGRVGGKDCLAAKGRHDKARARRGAAASVESVL
jgi:hypothetical protein